MTNAAPRRRIAAALVVATLLGLLGALATAPGASGQDLICENEDGTFVPCDLTTTTEDATTTTSDEGTTTTEDTVDDTDTTQPTDDGGDDEEVVTSPSLTVTTLRDLLVPGDGTEGAESTTTTSKALATGNDGISDETLILLVVGGLGLVSAVVSVLTWRYWTATRPTVAEPRTTK